jgi:hypothetical protein
VTVATRPRTGWRGPTDARPFPTLGWQVLMHMYLHLPSPADPTQPLILTDEQAEIILRLYEIDPMSGDFVNRRARLEMAKGWGKSPLAAAICIEEFAGPTAFNGWDEDGEPIGALHYWPVVEVAAVSEDQTDNTWAVIYELLQANEHRAAKALGIDIGLTRMYLTGGKPGTMRPVTAQSSSREGARLTFGLLDETHLWFRSNGGTKLAATLRRNAAKMGGRTFETTNAPVLGMKSVAEESGTEEVAGVLHIRRVPSEEPRQDMPKERLAELLREVYGDSYWAPIPRILAEIDDPATTWDDVLRFYFNVRSAGKTHAVDPREWDALAAVRDVPPGSYIALGFDGSLSEDSTVLRACTPDGYRFSLPGWAWVRPTGDDMAAWANANPGKQWRVPDAEVDAAVREAFARFTVGRMLPDAAFWRDYITSWQRLYGDDVVMPFDTNSARKMAPAFDRWRMAVKRGLAPHDGDHVVTDHVKAMHAAQPRNGQMTDDGRIPYVPVKGDDRRKIDGGLADILAYEAAMTMPELVELGVPEFFSL